MHPSKEHLHLFDAAYECEVSLAGYSNREKEILETNGAWLDALMFGEITPDTKEQEHFVSMCYGEVHPANPIEKAWKKYRLDLMYKVARKMETEISQSLFDYATVRDRFAVLVQQRHRGAINWLHNEGIDFEVPDHPSLINIAEIDPDRPAKIDILDTGAILDGSYGSSTR